MRLKVLYITERKGKLIAETIPLTKINAAIGGVLEVPKLSNSTGLRVEMIYDTDENKEPSNILRIVFDRISFDENGKNEIIPEDGQVGVKINYALYSNLSDSPLPVPIAPHLPTTEEIVVIKQHLNNKFPQLLTNPYVIEEFILNIKHSHQEDIKLFKKSHVK